jgi:hypothetical protein
MKGVKPQNKGTGQNRELSPIDRYKQKESLE